MFLGAEPRMWAPGTAEEASSLVSQPPVLFRAVSEALSAHPGVPGATGVERVEPRRRRGGGRCRVYMSVQSRRRDAYGREGEALVRKRIVGRGFF